MLLVTVRYILKDGTRDEFYSKVLDNKIIEESRKEAGNSKYDYYFPLDSKNDICLMELWSDSEAQAAHGMTGHYKRLAELKKEYVLRVELNKYEVTTKNA